jgi:hypothetical protein
MMVTTTDILDQARQVVQNHAHTAYIRELAQMLADFDGVTYRCPCGDDDCPPAIPKGHPDDCLCDRCVTADPSKLKVTS